MIVLLMFLLPLIGGLAAFFIKDGPMVRGWAILVSVVTMVLALLAQFSYAGTEQVAFSTSWMGNVGSSFSLKIDGLSGILTLLTGIAYPLIFLGTWKTQYTRPNNFFALMLLAQAGLMGVFTATDALLFYFFWELALIPVYFLCSGWGGEKRIPVTFKFFIYTFTASVIMLVGLLYIYFHTADRSFALEAFYNVRLTTKEESFVFWMLFAAFAVKMPVFPFHTWQPDTYEQSPTAATMVLSGLMVKMGLFGVIKWVLPVLPLGSYQWGNFAMGLAVTGIIYSSVIAIVQDDLKRLIAYSSIAHLGLMAMTIFAETTTGFQGIMIQMFNHGINVIGLWIVVELIERQFGTRKLSELGGIAQKAPVLTTLLVVIALGNVALPLTNGFIGEFLMFNGIWSSEVTVYNKLFAALAGISIILSAVYTLNMIQKIFFGPVNTLTERASDIKKVEVVALSAIVILILAIGVYPQPVLDLTSSYVEVLMKQVDVSQYIIK